MWKRTLFRIAVLGAIFLIPLTIYLAPEIAAGIYTAIAALSPLWLPAALIAIAFPLWLTFARSQYIARIPYATMELKPGPETSKSARAMELVFYALYHRISIPRTAALLGQVRMPWSFEIYAHDGAVRFFVHLPTAHRTAVEARIRVEYPDIDIDEARDYSREIAFDPFTMRLVAREYTLAKPDPYPLKTYRSHEEERVPRDLFGELLTDIIPLGAEEHLFLSWIVMPHQRERQGFWEKPVDTLHEDAEHEIKKLVGPAGDLHALSSASQEVVGAIERALQKPSFDCGIRALYLADRKHFNRTRATGLDRLFDRFGDNTLNSFAAYDPRDQVGWPLSEAFIVAPFFDMSYFLNLYRRRAFFTPPYYGRSFVLNTEELATMYHLPHVTRTSPLSRAQNKRLAPPDNLPV